MFSRALASLVLGSFLLVGCGGGSSSSGSGGEGTPGTYRGAFEYSFKIRGEAFGQRVVPIVAVVTANNVVVQSRSSTLQLNANAPRNGNDFSATTVLREQIGSYSCVGPWTVSGTVGSSRVNGRLVIDYTCTSPGRATERLVVNSAWRAS